MLVIESENNQLGSATTQFKSMATCSGLYDFAGQIRSLNIAHPFMEGNGRSMRIWLDYSYYYEED